MTCAACVRRVEKALKKVNGVEDAAVSFATEKATVQHSDAVTDDALIRAVIASGYHAHLPTLQAIEAPAKLDWRLWLAILLTIPIVTVSMATHERSSLTNLVLGLATSVVVFGCGSGFFSSAWKSIKDRAAGMDTLVALGAGTAWAYSAYSLSTLWNEPHHQSMSVYFETAAVIVTLILTGRALESRAKHNMASAVKGLLELAPETALKIGPNGTEVETEISRIKSGETLRLRPGERVAVDGTVLTGESLVDESMLTGEPIPVKKEKGSSVAAGTINGQGALTYRAEKVGSDTVLASIIRRVESAQSSKAPIQKLADRVASIFVPVVIVLATLTFGGWMLTGHSLSESIIPAIAVLVIACPCALGLATPAAIMVGVGRGAQLGILVKDAGALEHAGAVKTVVFDKTGTLTRGKPIVTVHPAESVTREDLLAIAASVESHSEHPLARAVVARATIENLCVPESTSFVAIRGFGVQAVIGNQTVRVGSRKFMEQSEISIPHPILEELRDREMEGASSALVARGGTVIGFIELEDEVSGWAAKAVATLESLGVRSVMLTGDHPFAAEKVARAVGIRDFIAEVQPEAKADSIQKYRKQGLVAMVGDGLNDAPALAEADLGIAMGTGTGVAIDAAGITLSRSDLSAVPQAIRLARATLRTIRGNLLWAFGYNVVAIPIAMSGHLSPMIAAGAMAFSSLSVILHSLTLTAFDRDR